MFVYLMEPCIKVEKCSCKMALFKFDFSLKNSELPGTDIYDTFISRVEDCFVAVVVNIYNVRKQ